MESKVTGGYIGGIGKDDEEKYRTMKTWRNKGPCVEGNDSRIKEMRSRCKGDWEKSLEFQSTVRNGHIQGEEIDAIKAIVLGKDYNESILNDTRFLKGHVGDFQFMSNGLKAVKKKVIEGKESSAEIGTSKPCDLSGKSVDKFSSDVVDEIGLGKVDLSQAGLNLDMCNVISNDKERSS
ncbi:hypothetical protein V6N11_033825 [Hibiscus sabdariffa]|uniref:Uncharacterized protein n=1 Tax=Hibiscus sabdariffa TaxID=183260 RepID=A0ABR2S0N0_9ROSI